MNISNFEFSKLSKKGLPIYRQNNGKLEITYIFKNMKVSGWLARMAICYNCGCHSADFIIETDEIEKGMYRYKFQCLVCADDILDLLC